MMTRRTWAVLGAALLGCFYTPPNPPVEFAGLSEGSDPCQIGGGMAVGGRSVTVGLRGEVDLDRAPVPETRGESFIFGHAFDPLIRLDCAGRPMAALAVRWRGEDGGTRWVFELDSNATFWSGRPVTADLVVAGIQANGTRAGNLLSIDLAALRMRALDPVTVEIISPTAVALDAFAAPEFSVRDNGEGTGRYIPRNDRTSDGLRLEARDEMLPDLLVLTGEDPRDLVDRRADVIEMTGSAAVRYAETRRDFEARPLVWGDRYLLLADDGFPELPRSHDFVERLAEEAVRADARMTDEAGWWTQFRTCAPNPVRTTAPARNPRVILFDQTDPAASDLARRLSAVLRRAARPVAPEVLRSSILSGTGAAVLRVPGEVASPCLLAEEWIGVFRRYRVDALVDVRYRIAKAFLGPVAFATFTGGFEFRRSWMPR